MSLYYMGSYRIEYFLFDFVSTPILSLGRRHTLTMHKNTVLSRGRVHTRRHTGFLQEKERNWNKSNVKKDTLGFVGEII